MRLAARSAIALLGILPLASCGSFRDSLPQLEEVFDQLAQRETRNPVVVIHGILGSRLVERATDKVVWGAFTNESIDVDTPEGVRAVAVPLPGPGGAMAYDPTTAAVYPTGPVDAVDVDLLFGVVSIDVYGAILKALGVGGYYDKVSVGPEYADDHFTCFTYFYDWRRDNVENAIQLGRYLEETRGRIEVSARAKIEKLRADGSPEALADAQELADWLDEGFKFDVVAHSMGGLVARYYLRYGAHDLPADGSTPAVTWEGANEIDRLVLVGTPSLGAMDAFLQLVKGFDPGIFLPHYHHAILGTMPSIYQLLPRNRNRPLLEGEGDPLDLDLFDPDVWAANEWGLLDPESDDILEMLLPEASLEERHRRAREYLTWCLERAEHFHRALDLKPSVESPAEIKLFASDSIPTRARASMIRDRANRWVPYFDTDAAFTLGDGTVPRYSAIADLTFGARARETWLNAAVDWHDITFLPDDHVGLTQDPLFTTNLLSYLLEQPPRRLRR